ncbi:MAG: AAA-like domain-containing protein [Candidatus Magnetoovum sp. WYHC-5]|nr:AAA-like domain-containing protein [Candidatus Magnetoovum sp. WYHC-5]
MRRFSSYGPVDAKEHFCVNRMGMVEECLGHIVGNPETGGHYFTIWAPRQTGKTWLMRQVKDAIHARYGERFIVGTMSMQGTIINDDRVEEDFLGWVSDLIWRTFKIKIEEIKDWKSWINLFYKGNGIFDRPVILFIDEFDKLQPKLIDKLVNIFREMYLDRDSYLLHGLSLIGVRAVLGIDSDRGSPFNVQRSMHIPNFSKDEVFDLFQQYMNESGQVIEPKVIEKVYKSTSGQPGLVCWFGELITEKYNTGIDTTIDTTLFKGVYYRALKVEWNNTLIWLKIGVTISI